MNDGIWLFTRNGNVCHRAYRRIALGTATLLAVVGALLAGGWLNAAQAEPGGVRLFDISSPVVWGITSSEFVRVCLVGAAVQRTGDVTDWTIRFLSQDGETFLTKEVRVPQEGFQCVDTTLADLLNGGREVEPTGRVQFALRISPTDPVLPERLWETFGGNVYSIETIDALTGATSVRSPKIPMAHNFVLLKKDV
jgi:hypothetical protein